MKLNLVKNIKKHYVKIIILIIVLLIIYHLYNNYIVEGYDGKARRVCITIANTITAKDIYVSIYKLDKIEEGGSVRYKTKKVLTKYKLVKNGSKTFNFTTGNFGFGIEISNVDGTIFQDGETTKTFPGSLFTVSHKYQEKYTVKNFWGMKSTKYRCGKGVSTKLTNTTITDSSVDDSNNTSTMRTLISNTVNNGGSGNNLVTSPNLIYFYQNP